MSLKKEIDDFINELKSRVCTKNDMCTDENYLEYLKNWKEYSKLEEEIKPLLMFNEIKIQNFNPIVNNKEFEKENSDLANALHTISDSISKKHDQ